MATERDDRMQDNHPADRSYGDVARRHLDWSAGYDAGHADALENKTPSELVSLIEGMNRGLAIEREQAVRWRAQWEEMVDQLLNEAQRLLREGNAFEAHRAISGVRRSLDAPQDARIARMGLP
jgi:predicted GIY-YIG superfamily endonuclease